MHQGALLDRLREYAVSENPEVVLPRFFVQRERIRRLSGSICGRQRPGRWSPCPGDLRELFYRPCYDLQPVCVSSLDIQAQAVKRKRPSKKQKVEQGELSEDTTLAGESSSKAGQLPRWPFQGI